jgi:hypothetical protein
MTGIFLSNWHLLLIILISRIEQNLPKEDIIKKGVYIESVDTEIRKYLELKVLI